MPHRTQHAGPRNDRERAIAARRLEESRRWHREWLQSPAGQKWAKRQLRFAKRRDGKRPPKS